MMIPVPRLLFVATLATAALSAQTPQFARQEKPYLPAAHDVAWGLSCAAADVNGDTFPDLVVGRGPELPNQLFFGDADGVLREAPATSLPRDLETTAATALVDVDGDGDRDLVAGSQPRWDANLGQWVSQTRLYLGDGRGAFRDVTATQLPVLNAMTNAIVAADVDGDGDMDLVLATEPWANFRPRVRFSGLDRLYLNDGKGKFVDATVSHMPLIENRTLDVRFGDVDRDGDVDLVGVHLNQSQPAAHNVMLFLNDGKGRFADASRRVVYPLPWTDSVRSLELFDADGDRNLDIFVVGLSSVRTSNGIRNVANRLLLGDGKGGFLDAPDRVSDVPHNLTPGPVRAVDVDRDNDLDLVVAYLPRNVLLENDGRGRFRRAAMPRLPGEWVETLGLGAGVIGMTAADFDRDGRRDVAIVHPYGRKLYFGDGVGGFEEVSAQALAVAAIAPVAADFDGDGDLDVIAGHRKQNGRQLRYHRNDGKTGFVDETDTRIPDINQPWEKKGVAGRLAIGDVDGDGDTDLVAMINYAANPNNENPLRLFVNDGLGNFSVAPNSALPRPKLPIYSFVLGDVDGDGDLDFAAGTLGFLASRSVLYLNDGGGVFRDVSATHLPDIKAQTRDVKLVDVDRDRDLDLVLANVPRGVPGRNHLYLNDGRGRFQDATVQLPGPSDETSGVLAADLDRDGDIDLVFTGSGISPQDRLLLGDGRGRFRDVTATHVPVSPRSSLVAALGDADGDGDLDLVTTNEDSAVLWVNDGSGRFATSPRMPSASANTGVVFADFDNDGDDDLLLASTRFYTLGGRPGARSTLLLNLDRQIRAPRRPKVGRPYPIDFHYKEGYATGNVLFQPFVALKEAHVRVPAFGILAFDPALSVAGPRIGIAAPGGKQTLSVPIPRLAGLIGLPLVTQCLVVESRPRPGIRFSNALRDVIR